MYYGQLRECPLNSPEAARILYIDSMKEKNIYYVVAVFEYEGDFNDCAKVFLSVESANAYKIELEAEGVGDRVEVRKMAIEA
jgi:hypothetical protein